MPAKQPFAKLTAHTLVHPRQLPPALPTVGLHRAWAEPVPLPLQPGSEMPLLPGPGLRRPRRARPRCRPHCPGHGRSRPRSAAPVGSVTEPREGSAPSPSRQGKTPTTTAAPKLRRGNEQDRRCFSVAARASSGPDPVRGRTGPCSPLRSISSGPAPPPPPGPVAAAQSPGGPQGPGSLPPVARARSSTAPCPRGTTAKAWQHRHWKSGLPTRVRGGGSTGPSRLLSSPALTERSPACTPVLGGRRCWLQPRCLSFPLLALAYTLV